MAVVNAADGARSLRVKGVSKRFGAVQALRDVSLELGGERVTGVIGPNGSGKTTLANVITGFVRPNAGRVDWEGRNITKLAPYNIARIGIRRTFQQSMVFPELTVRNNVLASLEACGRDHNEIEKLLRAGGTFDSLRPYLDVQAVNLPFGLARFLGVAIATASHPRLLVLDEPAAGLSADETHVLADGVIRLSHEEGIAIIVIDHDMAFLLPLCDRLVALDAGSVIADGDPVAVRSDTRVIETYLGSGFA